MKIKGPQTISNTETLEDLRKFTDQIISQLVSVVNGKIDFDDNLDTSIVTFTFPAANTTYSVSHSLDRQPIGYSIIGKNISTDIYDGVGSSTEKAIFLRSSVANATVKVMVF